MVLILTVFSRVTPPSGGRTFQTVTARLNNFPSFESKFSMLSKSVGGGGRRGIESRNGGGGGGGKREREGVRKRRKKRGRREGKVQVREEFIGQRGSVGRRWCIA